MLPLGCPTWEQVACRGCSCLILGNVPEQVGWGPEQPDRVVAPLPTRRWCGFLGLQKILQHLKTNPKWAHSGNEDSWMKETLGGGLTYSLMSILATEQQLSESADPEAGILRSTCLYWERKWQIQWATWGKLHSITLQGSDIYPWVRSGGTAHWNMWKLQSW